MSFKKMTSAEVVVAIMNSCLAFQALKMFERYFLTGVVYREDVERRLKNAMHAFAEESAGRAFCVNFLDRIKNYEIGVMPKSVWYYQTCLELRNKTPNPQKSAQRYLKETFYSRGVCLVGAFAEEDIHSSLDILRDYFWKTPNNKLAEVINQFSDAQAELEESSREWKFAQGMIDRINKRRHENPGVSMEFMVFVIMILEETGWTKNPQKFARDYVNGNQADKKRLRTVMSAYRTYQSGGDDSSAYTHGTRWSPGEKAALGVVSLGGTVVLDKAHKLLTGRGLFD